MLADPTIDVVTIGTPSGPHREAAVAAARAGKHVIVEKPLEITLRRCDEIIEACRPAGRRAFDHISLAFPRFVRQSETGGRPGPFGRLTLGDASSSGIEARPTTIAAPGEAHGNSMAAGR